MTKEGESNTAGDDVFLFFMILNPNQSNRVYDLSHSHMTLDSPATAWCTITRSLHESWSKDTMGGSGQGYGAGVVPGGCDGGSIVPFRRLPPPPTAYPRHPRSFRPVSPAINRGRRPNRSRVRPQVERAQIRAPDTISSILTA